MGTVSVDAVCAAVFFPAAVVSGFLPMPVPIIIASAATPTATTESNHLSREGLRFGGCGSFCGLGVGGSGLVGSVFGYSGLIGSGIFGSDAEATISSIASMFRGRFSGKIVIQVDNASNWAFVSRG